MFVRSSHIAHAEVSLETAKEVIDKNSAIFLNAQEIVTHRPAQLSHHTTLPLHRDKHINYACSCKKKRNTLSLHSSPFVTWVFTGKLARVPPDAE